jgi:hypothetical protein
MNEGWATRWAAISRSQVVTSLIVSAILLPSLVTTAMAQPRAAVDFQLQKITTNFISSPQFTYTGAEQFQADQRERWLEVEVTFASAPEFTDELTLKYFILFNGQLLTGEVTHVNIAAARDNRSVMYVTPKTLQRLMLGRTKCRRAANATGRAEGRVEFEPRCAAMVCDSASDQRAGFEQKRNPLFAALLGQVLPNQNGPVTR